MYTFVAKVNYWNDVEAKESKEVIVLTDIASYSEAAAKIEDFYRDDLFSFDITCYDTKFLILPVEKYNPIEETLNEY